MVKDVRLESTFDSFFQLMLSVVGAVEVSVMQLTYSLEVLLELLDMSSRTDCCTALTTWQARGGCPG